MADSQDSQERTQQATPKRRAEAREKGEVARSRELGTMGLLMMSAAAMILAGEQGLRDLGALMRAAFSPTRAQVFETATAWPSLQDTMLSALSILAPFFVVAFVVAALLPIAVGGWTFSLQGLAFKWIRLDPIKGMGRVFSVRGLVEMTKALFKFALILGIAVGILWSSLDELVAIGHGSLGQSLADGAWIVSTSFLTISAATILIAAIDAPYQLWEYERKLKMSRQQVKDEMKETEGRPEVQSKIRAAQQEVAARRMMEAVPKADVVITNPTHFSVALRYQADRMTAPRVVAKGMDEVALRIRQIAGAHKVTQVAAPSLARALYFSSRIDAEIPAGLYRAVAQVLAYVYQLRAHAETGDRPPVLSDVPIPKEFER